MLILAKNIDIDLRVELPLSKSESNRALMISYYSGSDISDIEISDSDDCMLLYDIINKLDNHSIDNVNEIFCANAGTVYRFLMTALSMREGRWILAGDERMKQRPINSLVEALRDLGADIEYLGVENYSPIMIRGCRIAGGRVEVSAEQSSQFASSLLLASPLWENGLEMSLGGSISSLPYIDMTINMMQKCGINVKRNGSTIIVRSGQYTIDMLSIGRDWSAAAFWYEILALSNAGCIIFKDLDFNSIQADTIIKNLFISLGISSTKINNDVYIHKNDNITQEFSFNFSNSPDIFPAIIASCAGLSVNATFSGLKNLSIKESDRKIAMMTELSKLNVNFEVLSDDVIKMRCPKQLPFFENDNPIIFENYNDHRIAMALAPLSLKIGAISMNNNDVVSKSYPNFWNEIKNIFNLK